MSTLPAAPNLPEKPSTIIVGGGLAGLAAATTLSTAGLPVILLETRPRLGGRASSFVDQSTGEQIDNCQHVSLGCCTHYDWLCQQLAISDQFHNWQELSFVGPDGRISRLKNSWLPAPLHLTGALCRLKYLTWKDRLAIARGMRALVQTAHQGPVVNEQAFSEWLAGTRQTANAVGRFWQVVLVSALSETLENITVAHARKVFVDAFLIHRGGWHVRTPALPLDSLYGRAVEQWAEHNTVDLRLKCGVRAIRCEADRCLGVELRSGEFLPADAVVSTVPYYQLPPLLADGPLQDHPTVKALSQLESAPISSVHLWFDRPVVPLPHAVLIDRLSQWVFARNVDPANGRYYYQVVISASRDLAGRNQHEIAAEVIAELADIWPIINEAQLLHQRVVTEHRAVFSVRPGADALRPVQQSPISNLQWAGDWTQTGWPATMEGAVRSGIAAGSNVLRQYGLSSPPLPADRIASPLASALLRL